MRRESSKERKSSEEVSSKGQGKKNQLKSVVKTRRERSTSTEEGKGKGNGKHKKKRKKTKLTIKAVSKLLVCNVSDCEER